MLFDKKNSFSDINIINKVGKYWSKRPPLKDEGNFYQSPITRSYIIKTAFGDKYIDKYLENSNFALDIFIEKYLADKEINSLLSLCSGFGLVEREFSKRLPKLKKCVGLDIAEGGLAYSKKKALEEGFTNIEYKFADLNSYTFEKGRYDLVIANGALHHIVNLENLVKGIYSTLNTGGVFFATEYVGPNHQDYPKRQLELINSLYYLLPKELRARRGLGFYKKERLFTLISKIYNVGYRKINNEWPRWKKLAQKLIKYLFNLENDEFIFGVTYISQKKRLIKKDPSEGVRSSEIIPIIKSIFPSNNIHSFNGSILQNILDENFFSNYNKNNNVHKKIFDLLCSLENQFIEMGEIGSDNAFIICIKE